jgi:Lrp/AsnC family transcriptional regulator
MRIDDSDRRLLRHLTRAPDAPIAALAEAAHLTEATVWRRLDRLRSARHLSAASTRSSTGSALGYAVEVSLRITLDKTVTRAFDDFLEAAREIPEVLEIQTFLGRVDLRLSVIARDMGHYQQLYRSRILTLPHIADIEALMHVARIKSDEVLPV